MHPWRRTLYIIFAAQVLTLIGFSCVFPFFPLYIQTLGVTGPAVVLWSGVITFGGSLTLALASPVWGALADRYGRKPMLMRAMGGGATITALLILAPNVWVVLVLRVLQGLVTGTVAPARALVASISPREHLGYSMGLMEASVFLGSAAGPLVGGVLNDHLGFHGTFAVGAGLLLSGAVLVGLRVEEPPLGRAAAGPVRHPLAEIGSIAAVPGLAVLASVLFMANFGSGAPSPVLPLLVPELSGVPVVNGEPQTATMVGVILAVAGFGATVAAWRAGRLTTRFGYRRTLFAALVFAGLFSIPAAMAGAVWQLLAVRTGMGICLGVALPAVSALVSLTTPPARQGAAYGFLASAELSGFAVGPLVGGVVGATAGLRAVFLVTAVVLFAVAAVVGMRVREPAPGAMSAVAVEGAGG